MKSKINLKKLKVQRENLNRINSELRDYEISVRREIERIKDQPARVLSPESIAKIKARVREIMDLLDINNIEETTLMYKQRELDIVMNNIKENEMALNKVNKIMGQNGK